MPIVSISLTDDLLKKIDSFMLEKGYSSRSEAIRDAVRDSLSEHEVSKFEEGRVTATLTAISGFDQHDVDERVTRLRHEHDDIVTGNMHIHLGKDYCLDILITEGKAAEVLNFIGKIRALRGIHQVRYTVMPIVDAKT